MSGCGLPWAVGVFRRLNSASASWSSGSFSNLHQSLSPLSPVSPPSSPSSSHSKLARCTSLHGSPLFFAAFSTALRVPFESPLFASRRPHTVPRLRPTTQCCSLNLGVHAALSHPTTLSRPQVHIGEDKSNEDTRSSTVCEDIGLGVRHMTTSCKFSGLIQSIGYAMIALIGTRADVTRRRCVC